MKYFLVFNVLLIALAWITTFMCIATGQIAFGFFLICLNGVSTMMCTKNILNYLDKQFFVHCSFCSSLPRVGSSAGRATKEAESTRHGVLHGSFDTVAYTCLTLSEFQTSCVKYLELYQTPFHQDRYDEKLNYEYIYCIHIFGIYCPCTQELLI